MKQISFMSVLLSDTETRVRTSMNPSLKPAHKWRLRPQVI